jgi:hypothetical protein
MVWVARTPFFQDGLHALQRPMGLTPGIDFQRVAGSSASYIFQALESFILLIGVLFSFSIQAKPVFSGSGLSA